jgi:hypothetical protein
MTAPSALAAWAEPKNNAEQLGRMHRPSNSSEPPVFTLRNMSMRRSIVFLLLTCGIALGQDKPPAPPTSSISAVSLSEDQIRDLIRQTAEKDMENDKKQRDYTYIQREEERKLDGKGQVKSTETKTSEIMELYGEQVERLIAKDDKPLSDKEAKKEEEKIQKLTEKHQNESEEDRQKRAAKEEKDREQSRQFVREVADAYNFHLVSIDSLDGRKTYVIDGEPRPGYQAHLKEAKILPKFRFRAWIDQDEQQWKKLDIQCIDTVSFGLFLARIHKGSSIVIEQTRINDEVWLPQHVAVKIDVRVALLKDFNVEQDIAYRDYKKFRASTKILPASETSQ